MKVLFLTTTLSKGGAEKQLLYLMKGLIEKKIEVHLLALESGGLKKEIEDLGVHLTIFSKKKSLNFLSYIKPTIQHIKKIRPDIVHSFLFHTNIIAKLSLFFQKKTFKLICSYRSDIKTYPLLHLLEFINMNKADLLISNSPSVSEELSDYKGMKHKRKVISNGFTFSTPRKELIEKLKKTYQHKTIILTVANMRKEKDYLSNIRVAQILEKKNPHILFLYAGLGPQEKNIKQIVHKQKIKNVEFLGKRTDILELFSITKVFFLPTKNEGQSNSLIEAMHMKVPIVTTNIKQNTQLVPHAKFCKVEDLNCMAKSILTTIEKQSKKELEENYQKIKKEFTVSKMVSAYIKTYEELLCVE